MDDENQKPLSLSELCGDANYLRPKEKKQVLEVMHEVVHPDFEEKKSILKQSLSLVSAIEDHVAISASGEPIDIIRIELRDPEEFDELGTFSYRNQLINMLGGYPPIRQGDALIIFPENGETAEDIRRDFDAIRSDFDRAAAYEQLDETYREMFCDNEYIDEGRPLNQEVADIKAECKSLQAYKMLADILEENFALDGLANVNCEEKPLDFSVLNKLSPSSNLAFAIAHDTEQNLKEQARREKDASGIGHVIDASEANLVRLALVDSAVLDNNDVMGLVQVYNEFHPDKEPLTVREESGVYNIAVPDGENKAVLAFLDEMLRGEKSSAIAPTGSADLSVNNNVTDTGQVKGR